MGGPPRIYTQTCSTQHSLKQSEKVKWGEKHRAREFADQKKKEEEEILIRDS